MNNRIKILGVGSEERRYQVDLSEVELGLMSDLLNSVSDLRAAPLRQAVDHMIRANNAFILLQDKKIIKCKECNGTGSIKYPDIYNSSYKKQPCNNCGGDGRLVIITSTRHEAFTEQWREELTPEY